jgi:hypothetical protein
MLRDLLGEDRWREYSEDARRDDVAELLAAAAADGRDVGAVIKVAVTCRPFEDDPVSPAHRVAGVLHYRIKTRLDKRPRRAHPAARQPDERSTR